MFNNLFEIRYGIRPGQRSMLFQLASHQFAQFRKKFLYVKLFNDFLPLRIGRWEVVGLKLDEINQLLCRKTVSVLAGMEQVRYWVIQVMTRMT